MEVVLAEPLLRCTPSGTTTPERRLSTLSRGGVRLRPTEMWVVREGSRAPRRPAGGYRRVERRSATRRSLELPARPTPCSLRASPGRARISRPSAGPDGRSAALQAGRRANPARRAPVRDEGRTRKGEDRDERRREVRGDGRRQITRTAEVFARQRPTFCADVPARRSASGPGRTPGAFVGDSSVSRRDRHFKRHGGGRSPAEELDRPGGIRVRRLRSGPVDRPLGRQHERSWQYDAGANSLAHDAPVLDARPRPEPTAYRTEPHDPERLGHRLSKSKSSGSIS